MTQIVQFAPSIDAPDVEPRSAQLLDTVQPIDGGVEWAEPAAEGGGVYTSLNCLDFGTSYDICDEPSPTEFQDPVLVNITRFVSNLGVKCQSLGFGDIATQFEKVVALRESANVELNVMTLKFTGVRGGDPATDITPAGGAQAIENGIALLEGHAAANYAGLPIIHSPVTVASVVAGDPGFTADGKIMRTGLGTRFVAGAGYEARIGPTGAVAAAGEWWVYATGEMRIRRGRRLWGEPVLDRASNIFYIRSARPYVIDVDCYQAAVRVKF